MPEPRGGLNDLEFDDVSKRYRVEEEHGAPGGARLRRWRRVYRDFWAVRNVSFAVRHGEAVGIIGHNGAGKSTILKLIASITAPTAGQVRIYGRLAALIEVGSGFHPELTGRENVYLNGSILGMRRREIAENFERIVEFAGVRQFIDTPVKRYSSGMYVRLGFAIAAHLNPAVLLLDEVLAVGDASFQEKCLTRIDELKRDGTTIVFISHDLGAVERLCDRAILMAHGRVAASGPTTEVIAEYERSATTFVDAGIPRSQAAVLPRIARVTGVSFHDRFGRRTSSLRTGEAFSVRVTYAARARLEGTAVWLSFHAQHGALMCQLSTKTDLPHLDLPEGEGTIEYRCDHLGLQPGKYYIDVAVLENDWQVRCTSLRVDPGDVLPGLFFESHHVRHLPGVILADDRDSDGDEIPDSQRIASSE